MKVFHERGRLVKTSEETVDRSGPLLYSRQTGRSGTSAAAAAVLACLLVPMELPAVLKQRQNLREREESVRRESFLSMLAGKVSFLALLACSGALSAQTGREGKVARRRVGYFTWLGAPEFKRRQRRVGCSWCRCRCRSVCPHCLLQTR